MKSFEKLRRLDSEKQAFWAGFQACMGIPAIGLGSSMLGYAATVAAGEHPAWLAFGGTMLVWGLPGQVAMLEMVATKANFLFTILAVSFANSRLLPVTVTGITLVVAGHKINWFLRFILAHFLAVTGWAIMMAVKDHLKPSLRLPFYIGFSTLLFASGVICTLIGYVAGQTFPPLIVAGLVFITPLYLLLLICSARQSANILAIIFAMIGGIGFYPWFGDWAVLMAGVIGGSIGFGLAHFMLKPKQVKP